MVSIESNNYEKKLIPKNSFTIAGVSYYKDICKKIEVNDILLMIPEPENEYDENAIRICNISNEKCGYVPKYVIKQIKNKDKKKLKVIDKGFYEGNWWIRVKIKKKNNDKN